MIGHRESAADLRVCFFCSGSLDGALQSHPCLTVTGMVVADPMNLGQVRVSCIFSTETNT